MDIFTILLIISAFVVTAICFIKVGIIIGTDSIDEPIGTIHVNMTNPEEEFFRCTVDDDFVKSIVGPEAKPTVTFVVVID